MHTSQKRDVPWWGYVGGILAITMGLLVVVINHWQAIKALFK
jgi:hypothetical protein